MCFSEAAGRSDQSLLEKRDSGACAQRATHCGEETLSQTDESPLPFDLTCTLGISQFYTDVLPSVSCTKSTVRFTSLPKRWGLFAEPINPPRRSQATFCV